MFNSDERKTLKELWNNPLLAKARDLALDQVKAEVRNTQETCRPLSDNVSLEELLRSQGKVSGALRLTEAIEELIAEELTDG